MNSQALIIYSSIVLSQTLSIGPAVAMLLKNYLDRGFLSSVRISLSFRIGESILIFVSFLITSLLHVSNSIFNILGVIGGCYLIYLGLSSLRSVFKKDKGSNSFVIRPLQAVIIPITNPKALLFFIMFIPSYINSNVHGEVYWISYLYLGLVFIVISFITDILYLISSKLINGIIGGKFELAVSIISPLFLIITGIVFIFRACHVL